MTARAFTVECLPRRSPPPNTAPLPDPVRAALGSIASDLRDIPRDCLTDRMELLHWLRRTANRVDGVSAMAVAATTGKSPVVARPRHRHPDAARPVSAREVAEAVFGAAKPRAARTAPRTITTREGRSVRVETRPGRDGGQMDLWSG